MIDNGEQICSPFLYEDIMAKRNKNTKKYQKWRVRVNYKNALKEWSELVRERDNNRCVICESLGIIKTDNVQAHHILDKRYYKELSLHVNVGLSCCVRCHKWSKFAAHTNAIWFTAWLQKHRPEQYKWCLDVC
jgi:hypothetical protein